MDEPEPFFDRSLDLLCVAGFDGYFTRLNPMSTTCLGWSIEELRAEPFLHFVHPDDRDATQAEVTALDEGIPTIRSLAFLMTHELPDRPCRSSAHRQLRMEGSRRERGPNLPTPAFGVTRSRECRWLVRETPVGFSRRCGFPLRLDAQGQTAPD